MKSKPLSRRGPLILSASLIQIYKTFQTESCENKTEVYLVWSLYYYFPRFSAESHKFTISCFNVANDPRTSTYHVSTFFKKSVLILADPSFACTFEICSLTCQNMNILAWRPPSIIAHLRQTQKYSYQDELVDDDALLNATISDYRQWEDLHGAAFYCVARLWRSVAVQAEG